MPRGYYRRPYNWTTEETETLVEMLSGGHTKAQAAKVLGRSESAVKVKVSRWQLGWLRKRHFMTARDVAAKMGIHPGSKAPAWWISRGYLHAMQGYPRGEHREWAVTPEALYDFLANPNYYHLWEWERLADPELRAAHVARRGHRFLTVGEVAAKYCVVVGTVSQWIRLERLHAVRHGNWMVPEEALKDFVMPMFRKHKGGKRHETNSEGQTSGDGTETGGTGTPAAYNAANFEECTPGGEGKLPAAPGH